MPVTWEIRGHILIVAAAGDYRSEDLAEAVAGALLDPRFRPGFSLLLDGRFSEAKITTATTEWRVAWLASLRSKGFSARCAVVVREEPHRYGLARMASTLLEMDGVELEVFTDMHEAMAWLDPPPSSP
jgi:hypothetical protein